MRDEAAEVVGDEVVGFTNTHTSGFLPDNPTAEYRASAVEVGERKKLLIDISFSPIFAVCLYEKVARLSDLDIRTFAGEDGFADEVGQAVRFGVCGQEPGAIRIQFP